MYSNQVREYVDKHLERASQTLDKASDVLRDAINGARYQKPPPPPPRAFTNPTSGSVGSQILNWVSKHKVSTAICLFSVGGIVYMVMTDKRYRKKRRAKKASNGARLEVVVLAGSPSEPITRSISLDLERRGFIVYIVCNTIEEEVIVVESMSRSDIKPLMIDIVDVNLSHCLAESKLTSIARECARIHRTLHRIPSETTRTFPRHQTTPSSIPLLDPHTLTHLPLFTNRHPLPLNSQRPPQHSCPNAHPHSSNLPPTPHFPPSLPPTPQPRSSPNDPQTLRCRRNTYHHPLPLTRLPRSRIHPRCSPHLLYLRPLLRALPSGHSSHTSETWNLRFLLLLSPRSPSDNPAIPARRDPKMGPPHPRNVRQKLCLPYFQRCRARQSFTRTQ